ncbi:MAG: glycerol-3-phosphate dehydrogenase [Thermomicrobiales bacterium]|nr:glycerol-3-phosphate dehydrogenase [Thermomicrobiales bacterium]
MSAEAPARTYFDLIVVGAGINGAGIARDAALRGLSVLLLDKGDIGSGTTSWSTRLIHGGLRYLEHGEIGLVRESLRERERLLHIAPHLVRPLPLLIPIYRGDKRGPLLIRAGMVAYDTLSFDKSLPRHRVLGRAGACAPAPGLAEAGLRGAALYHDAQVEYAERLALENALDARVHRADVRTYHEVEQILSAGGKVAGVSGRDLLTGARFRAEAPFVINVAGPWVDEVLRGTRETATQPLIGGTKGSHIVVDPFPGAPLDALYVEARRDARPFFIVPWNDAYLIGTTDIRYQGDLDWVSAEEWEIDFLLQETNRVIPEAGLAREHVRYSYAGVRPLPYQPESAEGSVTRRHIVLDHAERGGPRGLLSIVGGKLTTYRELAEQAVDLVYTLAELPMVPSRTATTLLPGGLTPSLWPAFRAEVLREVPVPARSAEHLLRVYGARAPELLATATTPALRSVIDPYTGAIAAEVPWAVEQEGARTLADIIARRTMAGLGPDVGIGADAAAARIARQTLGWDAARAESEVVVYREWVRRYRPRVLAPATTGSGAS